MMMMKPSQRLSATTRGSAQIVVLLILTMLGTISAAYVGFLGSSNQRVARSADDRQAFLLAEAGLAEALTALSQGRTGNVGTVNTPAALGGGMFWVEATDLGDNKTRLAVTACLGSGRAAIDAVAEGVVGEPLFSATLNSDEPLTMSANTMVDSFDSSTGDYASHPKTLTDGILRANDDGDLASNAGIVLNSDAKVIGDATPGPGHAVSFATGSYVHGSTTPATDPFAFPPIDVPNLTSSGPLTIPNGSTHTIPAGDHRFDDLTISKNAVVTIRGPSTIVVDNFTGGKDARIQIDATAGPVTVHVQGNYSHLSGFEADAVAGSPAAIAFFIQGTAPIVFPSNTAIRGAYYAPVADITFSSGNEAWGSFAGKSISMSSGMRFHYDEYLAEHWKDGDGGGGPPVKVLAWDEGHVRDSRLRAKRSDPFVLLGIQRHLLPTPADAWDLGVTP